MLDLREIVDTPGRDIVEEIVVINIERTHTPGVDRVLAGRGVDRDELVADERDHGDDMENLKTLFPALDWFNWPQTRLPAALEIIHSNWDRLERVAQALLTAPILGGVQRLTAEEVLAAFTSI